MDMKNKSFGANGTVSFLDGRFYASYSRSYREHGMMLGSFPDENSAIEAIEKRADIDGVMGPIVAGKYPFGTRKFGSLISRMN